MDQDVQYADVALLDVRSVCALLERRFLERDERGAVKLAARSTLRYIEEVEEKYRQSPSVVQTYLFENASAIKELREPR